MPETRVAVVAPTRTRLIIATLIVLGVVAAVWKVIDYRMQPPPPPHKVGAPITPH